MKLKISNSITILIISLLFFTVASCQQKPSVEKDSKKVEDNEIKESDFNEILANAKKSLDKKTYRLTETEKYFPDKNGEAESTEINITEFVLPDKRRTVKDISHPTKVSRYETIWDGENYYAKKDNEDWKRFMGGGGSTGGDFRSGRTTKIYKFLGMTEIDGQKAKLYSEETKRIANKPTRTSSYQVYSYESAKYWFDENGLLLKIYKESGVEKVVTLEGTKESDAITLKTSIYEYGSDIKIETPIVKEEK